MCCKVPIPGSGGCKPLLVQCTAQERQGVLRLETHSQHIAHEARTEHSLVQVSAINVNITSRNDDEVNITKLDIAWSAISDMKTVGHSYTSQKVIKQDWWPALS